MTQLFIGHKPGVGPVVKVLKHDSDNPLTLANDAYSSYLFNSENQKLTHIREVDGFSRIFQNTDPASATIHHVGGGASDAHASIWAQKEAWQPGWSLWFVNMTSFHVRVDNVSPFLPIISHTGGAIWKTSTAPAPRMKSFNGRSRWVINPGAQHEKDIVTSWENRPIIYKAKAFTPYGSSGTSWENWKGEVANNLSSLPLIGTWLTKELPGSSNGNMSARPWRQSWNSVGSAPVLDCDFSYAVWNLPANNTALPTFTPGPAGQEIVRISSNRVAVARPGYTVANSGIDKMILDSDNLSPALCVMAGQTAAIPVSGEVRLSPPPGIVLSEGVVVELMARKSDEPQYIPAHCVTGLVRTTNFNIQYWVEGNQLVLYNNGTFPAVVTYIVLNASRDPTSTGGSQVFYKGNDGTHDFCQIKKPGTSDPASRPNDIVLDTRLPTLHILKEGWLPAGSFAASVEQALGTRYYDVEFDAAGMIPFVMFRTVFPDYILPPALAVYYSYYAPNGPLGASSQSSICRLSSNTARFFLNNGSWVAYGANSGNQPVALYGGQEAQGIRYYIFGIPTP